MPTHAKFTTVWTITWPELQGIQRKPISKIILPSYKNVVFRFRLEFTDFVPGFFKANDAQKFGLSILYEDGPLSSLDDCTICCSPPDNTKFVMSYQAKRGGGKHRPNLEDTDIKVLKKKYGLDASDDLRYSITIAIPLTAFDYKIPKPEMKQRPDWLTGIFEGLEVVEKSAFSDVCFVAGDGGTFYCHRIIVGKQTKELETLLNDPMSESEKLGVIHFPPLDTGSLKVILKYLYTGEYDLLMELPVPLVIQVADFSEQYGLKVLKEASICQLWEIVVENPKDAIEILRFADLHSEAKYLKDRAMCVIMENLEKLSLHLRDFSGGNDNDLQGNRLKEEFVLYTVRRLGIWELQ